MELVVRLELDDAKESVAGQLVRLHERLDAVDELSGIAVTIGDVAVTPDVDVFFLDRLIHPRVA